MDSFLMINAGNAPADLQEQQKPGFRTAFFSGTPRRVQGSPNPWEPVRFNRLPVRSGSGLGRYQTGPNSKFKFKLKNKKFPKKFPKNISRCDEYNGIKFSQKFVHLV